MLTLQKFHKEILVHQAILKTRGCFIWWVKIKLAFIHK